MTRVAIVQKPPVFLDRERTIALAVGAVGEAADAGARLIVFPEAFVPGYPAWIWRVRPGADMALCNRLHAELSRNASVGRTTCRSCATRSMPRAWMSTSRRPTTPGKPG